MELFGYTGPERREWIDGILSEALRYYLGPTGMDRKIEALGYLNPVYDIEHAGQSMQRVVAPDASARDRFNAGVDVITDIASVVAPIGAVKIAGGSAVNALTESLLGIGGPTREGLSDWATDFARREDGMFLGPSALTADQDALRVARRMAKDGADRRAIWDETGWFQGVDGKWRFEIDDSGAVNDIRGAASETEMGERLPLGGVIEHSELYKAYPEMEDADTFLLSPERMNNVAPGAFGGVTDTGQLAFRNDVIDTGRPLHEMQHIIQQKEGFSSGGSPVKLGPGKYNRLAGEVEARNVESRALFDAGLRRATPPWETADVPEADQIVRFGGGIQASTDPATARAQGILDLGDPVQNARRADESGQSGSATLDPASLRSRFARFDPRLAHLRNLSAGLAGTGILAPVLMQDDDR